MKKKDQNTLLIVGGAAVLIYLLYPYMLEILKKKKKKGIVIVPEVEIPEMTRNIKDASGKVFLTDNDYFKDQYKTSLNACSY